MKVSAAFIVPRGILVTDHLHRGTNDGTCSRCRRSVPEEQSPLMIWRSGGKDMFLYCEPCTGVRTCRVCGCSDVRACITEDGPCRWIGGKRDSLCSACSASLSHIMRMTIEGMPAEDVATCACGWSHRTLRTLAAPGQRNMAEVRAMDDAIRAHWQAVVAGAAGA